MRGISLPVNIVVIIAIVVLVLVVIAGFVATTFTQQMSRTQAERVFSNGCTLLCRDPCESTYLIGRGSTAMEGHVLGGESVTEFHLNFRSACSLLGYMDPDDLGTAYRCMAQCGCPAQNCI